MAKSSKSPEKKMSFLGLADKCCLLSTLVASVNHGARRGSGNLLWKDKQMKF